jgi:outer membrane protein assembly factor BamB
MRFVHRSITIACLALSAVHAWFARADDWPHWRGPRRNDLTGESSGYRGGNWPLGEPRWSIEIGQGSSSPLVVGDRFYTLGWSDGHDRLGCFDAATGHEVWQQQYDCPKYGRWATGDEGIYSGPSSTPEYDDATKLLYTLSVDGDLNCWNTARNGARQWGFNLYERYAVPRRPRHRRSGLRDYGYTTSPLVDGDWVIVEVGDDEGALMAFDKRRGDRRWASECRDPAGHTGGPVPITVEGASCLAVLNYFGLLVVRLDEGHEGRTVARVPWTTDFANNIATPAVQGNSVVITSGYNHHAICRFDVSLAGARKIWEQPLASKVCSPIIHDGHIYWAWQQMHCLDFATGRPRWSGGQFGDAGSCIATSDAKLIVWGGRGKLALVETAAASPDEYHELAVRDRLSNTDAWPHVVLSGQRLYCRDRDGKLICFRLGSE